VWTRTADEFLETLAGYCEQAPEPGRRVNSTVGLSTDIRNSKTNYLKIFAMLA
jgi:hypothetical protein